MELSVARVVGRLLKIHRTPSLFKVREARERIRRTNGALMNKNKKSLVRQFRNDDPTTYLTNKDQQKAMLKEDIKAKKIEEARKKIMVEPINIPVNLTIPHRPLDLSKHYIRPKM